MAEGDEVPSNRADGQNRGSPSNHRATALFQSPFCWSVEGNQSWVSRNGSLVSPNLVPHHVACSQLPIDVSVTLRLGPRLGNTMLGAVSY